MRIDKLIDLLKDHRVFIQTHNFPDADAIASAYGLRELLKAFGVDSTICYQGKMERLNINRMTELLDIEMKAAAEIPDMTSSDYIVYVDAQKYNSNVDDLIGDEVACIDHHPIFTQCEYAYCDIRQVGACASIITDYYLESNTPIPPRVATALAYGLKMDTMDLRRGVTEFDLKMYQSLFPHIDNAILNSLQLNTMEFNDLQAYGTAIQNIQVYDNVGIAYIPFDCSDGLIASVSDFILALDVIEFSIIYSARSEGYKFSVRSELPSLNAGRIVAHALNGIGNGGGHAAFAGGYVPKANVKEWEDKLQALIRTRFIDAIHDHTTNA